jgi:antibiotic biosynthesis monooxygenase (ABM) superfamily enzyme
MALLTMLVAYPLMYGIGMLLRPWLERLPMALRGLAMTILVVSLLTWVFMPLVTRLFRHWLYPTSP